MKTTTELTKPIHYVLLIIFSFLLYVNKATTQQILHRGFSVTPDSSVLSFQSLLNDPTGNFSLGFLRVDRSQLSLAILHVPSSETIWLAKTSTSSIKWSKPTKLFFNGSLVLSDQHKKVIWSTQGNGDSVLLLNNSNLQIQSEKSSSSHSVLWQSFDFPSDTLIENQNFTVEMSLVSSNGLYSMRLGDDYLGLYTYFDQDSNQIYWKHRAMQAKAEIVEGQGPIYAQISLNGFLGMYQKEQAPVDVLPFDSFQRPINGIRRLRLESDGNIKAYYWNGLKWITDFTAISDVCELPNSCGSYGLCRPGKGCQCLDNKTEYQTGECFSPESGDLCREKQMINKGYWILRRKGVELPYKELMAFEKMGTLDECEGTCEKNCSCWGALFNNVSGYCYFVDYPINSLVSVGDENKLGFFKVRRVAEKKRNVGYAIGVGLLVGALVIFVGFALFGIYTIWRRKQRMNCRFMEDGVSPGPYSDLGSSSFRSIELCKS
ncbi:Pan domain-containing protein [Thalictrum thalictroides]|uniref:Pan domain-containing protein n=1 Tax=Thalictrum thalictroides TaxID=46969 RepID=A0A7J6VRM5_THATH|nr:Pan domain-containing protein [Thalictrum thalictroides]